MSTVESDVDVNVPISVACNRWAQFESFPKFMDSVEEITQLTDVDLRWRLNIAGVDRDLSLVQGHDRGASPRKRCLARRGRPSAGRHRALRTPGGQP